MNSCTLLRPGQARKGSYHKYKKEELENMSMKKLLTLLVALMMMVSVVPAFAYSNPQTDTGVTDAEIAAAQVSLQISKEGIVLLENNGALPIAKEGNVALFGIGSIETTKGGTGSGAVNNRIVYADGTTVDGVAIAVSILDGFRNAGYNVLTADYLEGLTADDGNQGGSGGMGASNLAADTALEKVFTDDALRAIAEQTDTAFYTIRRNAGEGSDRRIENDYNLYDVELKNIAKLAETFDKLVVLLNVINCDASWFAESGADALVLVSNPGELGGDAVVSVLNGDTNPSGKLVDTWAKSIYDWPSTTYFSNINPYDPWGDKVEFYYEDVFVGYRYFDTYAADKVLYDFGYGLSYTTFDIAVDAVTADAKTVAVTATVKNTGDVAGKEVVEIYFSAPQGKLLKPYQELIAYGKTDEIAPGESQTLTIAFQTSEMSSYSEEDAAYILEAGDYIIRVGNSSRNTVPAAKITLDAAAVTEQLANNMSITRYGVYPGGSSNQYPYQTQEGNVAQFNTFSNAFQGQNRGGVGLNGGSDAPIELALSAADIETVNPYAVKGVDPYSHAVNAYISDTTEKETAGAVGYDYALGVEYPINPVVFEGNFRVKSGSEADGTAEYYTLIDVQKGDITLEQFISGLTISELADFVEGGSKSPNATGQSAGGSSPNTAKAGQDVADYINAEYVDGQAGQTAGLYIFSRAIPTMTNADGPAGLRISQSYTGLDGNQYYQYCTAYPVGTMIAQTWNTDLAFLMGTYVGREMNQYGVTEWLAPGMNIHRNPLCGRNFEYYSEDPLIAGQTGGYEALGVQSNVGVGVTFKHFAGNDQENSRNSQNDVVSERAFREIYLKQFETAVKLSNPMGIMTTYGLVNGTPTANDYELLENILRTEWGFDGLVMTDWGGSGGMTDALAMHSGNDLIMPGGSVTQKILPYILDFAPNMELDENGLAIGGGYPATTASSMAWGTFVWVNVNTDWGDYQLSPAGDDYVVKTTEEAFTTKTVPAQVNRELVDIPVKEQVDSLVQAGTASYTIEDGIVTITYKLQCRSANDGTAYAASYAAHPITAGVNALGTEDINTLSLADLQKSVRRILTVAMRSLQWQECLDDYAQASGEDMSAYAVGSYTEAVGPTVTYVTVTK